MTRQDYIKIADVLRAEREAATMRAATQAVDNITRRMAGLLASDSPRFDRERFYSAAGMQEGRS